MASTAPPKKRLRVKFFYDCTLEEQIRKLPPRMLHVQLRSPHELHVGAYTAYERKVRRDSRLAHLSNKCDFKAAETTWVGTIDHALPTKSLPISRMSDSISQPRAIPLDDGQMPSDLRVLFAEDVITLASLLDKEFFVGMMRSAGNGGFSESLYSTAMAWVWAMLKLDFDPEGTPETENKIKHLQEQDAFHESSILAKVKMRRENVRRVWGDEGVVAIFGPQSSSAAAEWRRGGL